MLLSCNIPLPKKVVVHGFINDAEGRKMSKSIGNVVDPIDILDKYPSDLLRYYVISSGTFGTDISYNTDRLIKCNDFELQATIGNLVNRIFKVADKICDGKIPNTFSEKLFNIDEFGKQIINAYDHFELQTVISIVMEKCRFFNGWFTEKKAWKVTEEKDMIIRTSLEFLYVIGHFLTPIIPTAMNKLFISLNHAPKIIPAINEWNNLTSETKIICCEPLFPRILENSYARSRRFVDTNLQQP